MLNATGGIKDSGKTFLTSITAVWDNIPTEGAVKNYVDNNVNTSVNTTQGISQDKFIKGEIARIIYDKDLLINKIVKYWEFVGKDGDSQVVNSGLLTTTSTTVFFSIVMYIGKIFWVILYCWGTSNIILRLFGVSNSSSIYLNTPSSQYDTGIVWLTRKMINIVPRTYTLDQTGTVWFYIFYLLNTTTYTYRLVTIND